MAGSYANRSITRNIDREMSESERNFVDKLISEIESENGSKSIDLEGVTLTNFLNDVKNRSNGIIPEIVRCRGLSSSKELKRKFGGGDSRIRLTLPNDTFNTPPVKLLSEAEQGCHVEIFGQSRVSMEPLTYWELYKSWSDTSAGITRDGAVKTDISEKISKTAFEQLTEVMLAPAHYLPANRASVMNFHGLMVSGLLSNAVPMDSRISASAQTMTGVLSDFFRELLEIDKSCRRNSRIHSDSRKDIFKVADHIESTVLRGSIVTKDTSLLHYPDFYFKPRGWRNLLPLMNASSMVSEVAPLVLYLRGLVGCGDTIIIEEPESHLHPKMQIEFTKLLALLVMSGIKTIITTHSDWVINCISNIVLRGRRDSNEDDFARICDANELSNVAVRELDVGIWSFRNLGIRSGTTVEQLEFLEPGRYSPDYEDDLMDLHNEWSGEVSRRS